MNKHDKAVSDKTNEIRRQAGNPMTECPTCGRSASNPFRSYEGNVIVAGCVDAFHTDALVSISSTNNWHQNAAACLIRRETLQMLRSK